MAKANETKHERDYTKQVYYFLSVRNHVRAERQRGSRSEQSVDQLQLGER